MHMSKINWAILGGGRMSKVFAETIFKDKNSNLVSIASKTLKNRIYFNKKYNKNFSIFKDYDKILNDALNGNTCGTTHPLLSIVKILLPP